MSEGVQDLCVVVTGASGFIGAHLVARLQALGAQVHPFVADAGRVSRLKALGVTAPTHCVDLSDTDAVHQALARCRADVVFHLAAERDEAALIADPGWSASIGAGLLRACARHGLRRFVTIGSSLEIADPSTGGAQSAHGVAKARAMEALQCAARTAQVPFSAARTHYVYGPLHGRAKLIPAAIRAIAAGQPLPLTQGHIRKRFVYVSDVVEACLHLLNLPPNTQEVYWATSEQQHSNAQVVTRIGDLIGRPVQIGPDAYAARAWDRAEWPIDQAALLPGWTAQTALDDGLTACIEEVLANAAP